MSKIENDQFYTKSKIAEKCFSVLEKKYPELLNNSKILEPCAGTGSFVECFIKHGVKKQNIIAFDIEPKHSMVKQKDFLSSSFKFKNIITITNPPFGRRSKMAIAFFNKAATFSHTIAFIVPVQFQKFGVQSHLNKDFHLIYEKLLPAKSFENDGKDLSVRCCFQIWTRKEGYKDLRIKKAPSIAHPDFEMLLYNNTPETRKYFDYEWDFAVPRQGFYDYSLRITSKNELNPKVQYMFFVSNDNKILRRLINIDFDKLALNNTTIKGYGKADVVSEYMRLYKC